VIEGKALYRCDGCRLELHLLAPVERPCPNCGGEFRTVSGYNHPVEAANDMVTRVPKRIQSREQQIDAIVHKEAPAMIEQVVEFLRTTSEGSYGKEEGNDNRI
jgi:hypothetical protein